MEREELAGHCRESGESEKTNTRPENGDEVLLEHREERHHEHPEKENVTIEERPSPESVSSPKKEGEEDNAEIHDRDAGVEDLTTEHKDADALAQEEIVKNSVPTTELEIALTKILERKEALIDRITGEITKMKNFVKKRKQTYKRKRKEDGAPTRALSAYNMFIKEYVPRTARKIPIAGQYDSHQIFPICQALCGAVKAERGSTEIGRR